MPGSSAEQTQPGTLLSPSPLTLPPPPPRKPRAGGCTACPRAAAAGARALPHPPPARQPRAAPAPPPPQPAHRRRPPQPSPAPASSLVRSFARVRALPRTRPPRASLGARSRPRGPGRRDHVDGWAPSSPAPSPVVECVESKRLGAGRAREPRACALGRPGLRTGGGGEPRGGRGRGGGCPWRGPPEWGRPRPGTVGARGRGSRRRIRHVSGRTRAGPCSQAIPRAPPTSSSGHLPLDPLPPADQRPLSREIPSPQGCFPLGTCAARKGVQRRGTRGASLGGGRDWRRQNWERVLKRGPLLRRGAVGAPTGRVGNFSPTWHHRHWN
ncbi:uncharacterized protein LOC118151641 [Callithrix jacchus]